MRTLPAPGTVVELYLAAILEELQAVRTERTIRPQLPEGTTELREPQREPQRPAPPNRDQQRRQR